MPEYVAPGVYVEEARFRARAIEGAGTSVAGFAGPACYGPVGGEPELLTSFAGFALIYGGSDRLAFADGDPGQEYENYLAHAVRAFFDNGGSRLYVTRVYEPLSSGADSGKASCLCDSSPGAPPVTLLARFPGQAGNMQVTFGAQVSPNLLSVGAASGADALRVSGVQDKDVVYIRRGRSSGQPVDGLYDVESAGDVLVFRRPGETETIAATSLDAQPEGDRVHKVTLSVRVRRQGRFEDEVVWQDLTPHGEGDRALLSLFAQEPATRRQYLTIPFCIQNAPESAAGLVETLLGPDVMVGLTSYLSIDRERRDPAGGTTLQRTWALAGGNDGKLPTAETYTGDAGRRDGDTLRAGTGLDTFAAVDDISLVAAPGSSKRTGDDDGKRGSDIARALIAHCQGMRYRVALLDPPDGCTVQGVQDYRARFDSTHAALYYPWITIVDALDSAGLRQIAVPPCGFVAGICARSDAQQGVFKAPANEPLLGATGLEILLTKAQQDVLNPLGINCFRFFEERGYVLWGARTISADPEWKYLNVRRYVAYLEHSIERGTQWAVFEPNGEALWASVRGAIEDFLFGEWRRGGLPGRKPEEAFFVRCDRTTMTQNDLDNGRLVCMIGLAVVRPAEFVIIRIGQWTADRRE